MFLWYCLYRREARIEALEEELRQEKQKNVSLRQHSQMPLHSISAKDKYIPNLLLNERAPELLCTLRFFTLRNSDEVEKYPQRYS